MMLLFNNIIKKLKIKNCELQKNADFLKTIYCPNGGGIKFANCSSVIDEFGDDGGPQFK
jgi:hypothetical protein